MNSLTEQIDRDFIADQHTQKLRDELRATLAATLDADEAIVCTRVWEAWGYGTMTQDDFEAYTEGPGLDELVDKLMDIVARHAPLAGTVAHGKTGAAMVEAITRLGQDSEWES